MKRVLLIFLSLCALSVSALAADGDSLPPRWAFASDEEWQEAAAQSAATESSEPLLYPPKIKKCRPAEIGCGDFGWLLPARPLTGVKGG